MSLEIYLCPPGTKGFKLNLFKNAVDGISTDYSGVCYLSPSRHMSDAFRDDFHAVLREKGKAKCYIPPRISTLKEFSRVMASSYGNRKLVPKRLIPPVIAALTGSGMGAACVVSDFISEIKNHYPGVSPETIRTTLKDAFDELGIHEEVLSRTEDALDALIRYNDALSSSGFIDADDAMSADIANSPRIGVLILDGFYEIAPAEESFIENLIAKADRALATIPVSDAGDDLRFCYSRFLERQFGIKPVHVPPQKAGPDRSYYPSPSMEEELEGIARHIKADFLSGRLKNLDDAYIVFPVVSAYRDMAERVLGRYGIPYRIRSRPEEIHRDFLGLLDSVSEGYPRLAFARFLMSRFFKDADMERIRPLVPGICLSGVVKGKDPWLNALEKRGASFRKSGETIFRKLLPLESIKENASCGEFLKCIGETSKSLGFAPGDDFDLPALLGQIRLIGDITGRETSLKNLIDVLRHVSSASSGETAGEGVRIAEMLDARGIEPGYLYFAGVKDGDVPARPEIDYLLPEKVRSRLGLMDMGRYLHLQEHVFKRLTASAGSLRVSYPTMEGDRLHLPSLFLSDWEEKKERLFGVFSEEEKMIKRGKKPLSEYIGEIEGVRRYSDNSSIKVTEVDYYRQCPRRLFIEKILNLAPPEPSDYEIDVKTIGTIAHLVMQKAVPAFDPDIDVFKEKTGVIIDGILAELPIEPYFKALLKESFLGILPEIHRLEETIRSEGYEFTHAELPIEGEPVEGIRLKGKIDRIDRSESGGEAVIDYKTGGAGLSASAVLKKGESLQLFLYAALLKTMGMNPERVGIYSLKDLKIKWVPGAREKNPFDAFVEASLRYLEDTVEKMRKGEFHALPINEQSCRQCHERPYCPYIQK